MAQLGDTKPIGGIKAESLMKALEETNVSSFHDAWGPMKVLHVYDPEMSMQGILVIDNTSLGPGYGGIRINNSVNPREVFLRARTMTLTCALAGVEFGGAAAGIWVPSADFDRLQLVRAFARNISSNVPEQYIAAPDITTGQQEMRVFVEEIGDRQGATGKPVEIGGIPHELGVVGFGIGVAIEESLAVARANKVLPSSLSEARVAIQGMETAGMALAKSLANKGAKIVAISDDQRTISAPDGIDFHKLMKMFSAVPGKQPSALKGKAKLAKDDILKMDCDLLVLTTACNLITDETALSVKAKCIVEGVNNPVTPIADQLLTKHGTIILPDIMTTAGGPIAGFAEITRNTSERAFSLIESKVKDSVRDIVGRSLELGVPMRRLAKETAKERIIEALEVMG